MCPLCKPWTSFFTKNTSTLSVIFHSRQWGSSWVSWMPPWKNVVHILWVSFYSLEQSSWLLARKEKFPTNPSWNGCPHTYPPSGGNTFLSGLYYSSKSWLSILFMFFRLHEKMGKWRQNKKGDNRWNSGQYIFQPLFFRSFV